MVTSGLTVVVGFGALVTTPLTETRSVGIGGLIVVGVAVLLATMHIAGRWNWWPGVRAPRSDG
ncbi:MAG: hypothetical protein ACREL9_07255 [Gemmatimonadales bacterium]